MSSGWGAAEPNPPLVGHLVGAVPAAMVEVPGGAPGPQELSRCCWLDQADRALIGMRRGEDIRLGFAVQLATVRVLGTFLPDPLDVPWQVVTFLAEQLGVGDPSSVKAYTERAKTPYEHPVGDQPSVRLPELERRRRATRAFLGARAWRSASKDVKHPAMSRMHRPRLPSVGTPQLPTGSLPPQLASRRRYERSERCWVLLVPAEKSADTGVEEAAIPTRTQRAPSSRARRALGAVAVVAWFAACVADIGAAANYVYIEPTEAALATAAAAAGRGEILSVVILLLTVAVVFVRRQPSLLVLALPGVAGFVAFVARPRGHGAPLLALLSATLVAGVVAMFANGPRSRPPGVVPR